MTHLATTYALLWRSLIPLFLPLLLRHVNDTQKHAARSSGTDGNTGHQVVNGSRLPLSSKIQTAPFPRENFLEPMEICESGKLSTQMQNHYTESSQFFGFQSRFISP